jgi:hypothetical protein
MCHSVKHDCHWEWEVEGGVGDTVVVPKNLYK